MTRAETEVTASTIFAALRSRSKRISLTSGVDRRLRAPPLRSEAAVGASPWTITTGGLNPSLAMASPSMTRTFWPPPWPVKTTRTFLLINDIGPHELRLEQTPRRSQQVYKASGTHCGLPTASGHPDCACLDRRVALRSVCRGYHRRAVDDMPVASKTSE